MSSPSGFILFLQLSTEISALRAFLFQKLEQKRAVAHELLRIIFAIGKHKQKFDPDFS